MDVTFSKMPGRRYRMAVVRERGPELAARQGPGYHDYLPHDAVHFMVEAEARLTGGVFGRVAAGRNNLFSPVDPEEQRKQKRREERQPPTRAEHADMALSERLASNCTALWEFRAGLRSPEPPWFSPTEPDTVDPELVERVMARLADFAGRWHALPVGGGLTLTWPVRAHDRAARRRS